MRVFARVYTRPCSSPVRAIHRRVVPRILRTSVSAQAHKRARDAKERRSEDERRLQMNFNERRVIWALFFLSFYFFSPFLSAVQGSRTLSLELCIAASLPRSVPRSSKVQPCPSTLWMRYNYLFIFHGHVTSRQAAHAIPRALHLIANAGGRAVCSEVGEGKLSCNIRTTRVTACCRSCWYATHKRRLLGKRVLWRFLRYGLRVMFIRIHAMFIRKGMNLSILPDVTIKSADY